jgi:hypothetical protein
VDRDEQQRLKKRKLENARAQEMSTQPFAAFKPKISVCSHGILKDMCTRCAAAVRAHALALAAQAQAQAIAQAQMQAISIACEHGRVMGQCPECKAGIVFL